MLAAATKTKVILRNQCISKIITGDKVTPKTDDGWGTADHMQRWIRLFSPSDGPSEEHLVSLVAEAVDAATDEYGEKEALEWAEGYAFPQSLLDSHVRCLQAAQLDFISMVKRRFKSLSGNRLNINRVASLRPDNPEKIKMMDLAVGMKVHLPNNFQPNGADWEALTPLRRSYVRVHPAVNKMLGAILDQQLAFILPTHLARQHVPKLHLCKAHWTQKKGKKSGRPLGDLTYVDGCALNTPETAKAAAEYYGEILHPTIDDIVNMIMNFWKKSLDENLGMEWSSLRIWKMDLKGAYTLISFRPEDIGLFAMQLTNDLIYLQLVGIFGWAGTPAAFQAVTRAIQWELKHRLAGSTLMYVDDIIGVCFENQLTNDLKIAHNVCTDLLGPGAVADDKQECGRRLDIIGYVVDLDLKRVMISRKNFLTALHGFLKCDLDAKMSLHKAQQLASWGSRYGRICRVMRPFCGALNRLTLGRSSPHARLALPTEARIAISCWRAMLCLVRYNERQFTRQLESFTSTAPTIVAEFDASLSGLGIVWYKKTNDTEVCVGVCAASTAFLGFQDNSSFQNLSEFIGAIVAVAGLVHLGYRGCSLELRGDSVTALQWAITERPRGTLVTHAAMVWTLLCISAEVNIASVTHLPGKDNHICDSLSRRGATPDMTVKEHALSMGINGKVLDVGENSAMGDIIKACDPSLLIDSEEDFARFWCRTKNCIEGLLSA